MVKNKFLNQKLHFIIYVTVKKSYNIIQQIEMNIFCTNESQPTVELLEEFGQREIGNWPPDENEIQQTLKVVQQCPTIYQQIVWFG